uniref:VWFA domain-containing protein n=1 Tax=Esox lucius TaxID=8010 RepID=A0A6Q2WSJ0_ESOLU
GDWEPGSVLCVLTFNIDPVAWKHISTPADGFGYKVVQWNPNSLLISAPLEQYEQNRRGKVYKCQVGGSDCKALSITVPSQGINMSLGLSMTKDPMSSKAMVCGPTIPRECKTITTYNGMCFQIEQSLSVGSAVPSSLEECPGQTDIAFLLDGSGSVNPTDFVRMKTFVKDLISPFLERDTRFALAQYSGYCQIHFKFTDNVDISQVDKISQQGGGTYTAAAITKVVQEIFNSEEHRKRILIVITDGQSHDSPKLKNAASEAEKKNIIRFAIGVGRAFRTSSAMEELNTIASSPSNKHVFQVGSFEALNQIKDTLQSSIFPIEGSLTNGESIKMEMAQEGFSAAYLPLEGYLLGSVGAFQWRGAYLEYKRSTIKATPQQSQKMEPDSYMGYSMAVARTRFRQLTILGAPRFNHTGRVVVFYSNEKPIEIGAYFGAEICVVDLENDFYTDLVLISAPMFKDKDREGLVFVCTINTLLVCTFNAEMTLKGAAGIIGRFGTSLAPLPDLNVDGFNDLAVGAPLENNGQGSVYIFHGSSNGIRKIYSQRISGSDVQSGLMFFGLSISPSSLDMSLDSLPDLAVGSKGAVIILRSRPIVTVTTEVFFSPSKISTKSSSCNTPHKNTAKVCFTMTKKTAEATKGQARVNYTLTLDVTRQAPNYRAYYNSQDKIRKKTETVPVFQKSCWTNSVFSLFQGCPDDALNELSNELDFTFEGIQFSGGLSPSLSPQSRTTSYHPLGFEINCGTDNNCVDNLKVDFNFTGSLEMKVGIDDVLNVTVSVESLEENSYNSRVIVTYPAGLSFRKFTTIQGRVECNSMDSEHGVTPGQSDCVINKPIFRSNSKVCSTHNLIITTSCRTVEKRANPTATAGVCSICCGNNAHSLSSELFREKKIGVKYSIYVLITRHEDSTQYIKFTAGKNDLQKHVKQSFVVVNYVRDFNLTVIIKVPMKLGDKSIWADQNSIQIPGCHRDKNEGPISTDFVYKLKKDSILDCSVATCGVFMCNVFIRKDAHNSFNISGNLSSGWIEQIGLESAQFSLVSTATLAYDRNQYIYFSSDSKNNPHFQTIETQVEVYTEVNFTKEIIGGAVGGLFLLALITAGLYKAGFFKSHYKQMMNDASGDMPGNDGEAALAE